MNEYDKYFGKKNMQVSQLTHKYMVYNNAYLSYLRWFRLRVHNTIASQKSEISTSKYFFKIKFKDAFFQWENSSDFKHKDKMKTKSLKVTLVKNAQTLFFLNEHICVCRTSSLILLSCDLDQLDHFSRDIQSSLGQDAKFVN